MSSPSWRSLAAAHSVSSARYPRQHAIHVAARHTATLRRRCHRVTAAMPRPVRCGAMPAGKSLPRRRCPGQSCPVRAGRRSLRRWSHGSDSAHRLTQALSDSSRRTPAAPSTRMCRPAPRTAPSAPAPRPRPRQVVESPDTLYLLTEVMSGGELFDTLQGTKTFSEQARGCPHLSSWTSDFARAAPPHAPAAAQRQRHTVSPTYPTLRCRSVGWSRYSSHQLSLTCTCATSLPIAISSRPTSYAGATALASDCAPGPVPC